jgi:signal transduction histidine kinase
MSVLRQEVDRMQSIVEEFLDFSRPLVPLALTDLALDELVHEVVRLHEGSALERRVTMSVEAPRAVSLRADRRKIRQVLINVLQNALDASPAEGVVTVRVEAAAEGRVRVRVIDAGSGLDSGLAERLFEAGVTSKEHGSGIGLVVARSLARQHGGELTLANGPQRGAIAELVLPRNARGAEP